MDAGHSLFWDDLAQDLKDPEFLREYVAVLAEISTFDSLARGLGRGSSEDLA